MPFGKRQEQHPLSCHSRHVAANFRSGDYQDYRPPTPPLLDGGRGALWRANALRWVSCLLKRKYGCYRTTYPTLDPPRSECSEYISAATTPRSDGSRVKQGPKFSLLSKPSRDFGLNPSLPKPM